MLFMDYAFYHFTGHWQVTSDATSVHVKHLLPLLSSTANSRRASVFKSVSVLDTVGIWIAAINEKNAIRIDLVLVICSVSNSTLTTCPLSASVTCRVLNSFTWWIHRRSVTNDHVFLPLKFSRRSFLCCGDIWGEMLIVFSHLPSWSPALTSNVNVLTVATRNTTVSDKVKLSTSTFKNVNNLHCVLRPVMFQEVQIVVIS